MTTAQDVIAKALADRFDGEFDPVYLEDADGILRALIAAPESVRMELAALLNPDDNDFENAHEAVRSAVLNAAQAIRTNDDVKTAHRLLYDGVKAAAAMLSPGRSINPWRPIETVPKDGNEILLGCFGEAGHGGQFVAFWDDEAKYDTHRWQTADGIAYHNDLPTHWQPLPAPPSEDKT